MSLTGVTESLEACVTSRRIRNGWSKGFHDCLEEREWSVHGSELCFLPLDFKFCIEFNKDFPCRVNESCLLF